MSRITTEEYNRLLDLVLEGKSVRAICAESGLSRNTVMAKRNEILRVNPISCGCGKDIKHAGWCKWRLSRAPKRRDFLSRWTRHQKIEWCWRVLCRLTRNRFVAKEVLQDCLVRLAHKHSNRPQLTIERLSNLHWLNGLGAYNCQPIYSQYQVAEIEAGTRYCKIPSGVFCRICEKPAYCESLNQWHPTCESEWCKRIHAFYFVDGRNRPPTVRGVNKGLKFEFFLSDYIRRYAHEQARSQHHRPA